MEIKDKQIYLITENQKKEENQKAIIRGAFMGSGSVNNPEKEYHLEVDLGNNENLIEIIKILQQLGIGVKTFGLAIYIKEGEEISKFLALIGANKAVMQFEDIRIQKEMRGKVNRLVNCETANLNKTVSAAVYQIQAIEKLKKEKKFEKLPQNLQEIAKIRLKHPEMTLADLGKMLTEPIRKIWSKS